MMVLFLIANRGAYQGYFQDDDLDNISWTPFTPLATFAREVVAPRLSPVNFRPAGHFYFRVLASVAGLRFPWYVAGIHALHFLNVWLLYLLMRRLAADRFTSGAGAVLFAFHMAVFDALLEADVRLRSAVRAVLAGGAAGLDAPALGAELCRLLAGLQIQGAGGDAAGGGAGRLRVLAGRAEVEAAHGFLRRLAGDGHSGACSSIPMSITTIRSGSPRPACGGRHASTLRRFC